MVVALRWIVGAAIAASTASAHMFDAFVSPRHLERDGVLGLHKRQNLTVGSPLYNCHDNCGVAIEEIQNCGSVCNDTTFINDYSNCLQCSGPDNQDIWQYYGPELNTTAAACGFSTSPLSGAQDAVDLPIAASNSTAACMAAQESHSTSTASSTGSAASASSTSSSGAAPVAAAHFAAYGAVAVGVFLVHAGSVIVSI